MFTVTLVLVCRRFVRCNWMLRPQLFSQINKKMGPLEVDMFACIPSHTPTPTLLQLETGPSRESNRCICSRLESYSGVCKPWCLLLPTLAKIQWEKAKVVPCSGCNMEDTTMIPSPTCRYPLLIPLQQDVVTSPNQEEFIMPEGVPRLATWPLSGIKADQEGFLKELHIYWSPHG